jgi:hypothetical protein
MSRTRIALLCVPIALVGLGAAVYSSVRVSEGEKRLAELAVEGRAAGQSFVDTLQGEHAERLMLTYDRRREAALALAAARRDRLLGLLAVGAAGLLAAGLLALSRIAAELEEDRRIAEDTPDPQAAAPGSGRP